MALTDRGLDDALSRTLAGGRTLPGEAATALLDRAGVVLAVNQPWTDLSVAAPSGAASEVGVCYVDHLSACATGWGDLDVGALQDSVRAAGRGDLLESVAFRASIPLGGGRQGPTVRQSLQLRISSRVDDRWRCLGALVALSPAAAPDPAGTRQALLEVMPDGLLLSDTEGRIAFVNQRIEYLTGYTRAELLGQPVEVLVPWEARERHGRVHTAFRSTARAAPTRTPRRTRAMAGDAPVELRQRDGARLPVEVTLVPVRFNGQAMTAAGVRDVTTQRAADRELRRLLELLHAIPDAVLVTNADTLVVEYANQAASDLLGYPQERLAGMPAGQLGLAPDVAAHPSLQAVVLRDARGELIPCQSHLRPVVDDEDGATYLVNAVRRAR